jgi:polyhydroxyalkanoate synthesis regulator phasin
MVGKTMDPDTLFQTIQKGFRVGVGATTTFVEALQNPQIHQQNFEKLRSNPDQLIADLAQKGEITERDARTLVDQLIGNRLGNRPASEMTVTTTAVTISPDAQAELRELTQQLVSLRQELQELKNQRSQN